MSLITGENIAWLLMAIIFFGLLLFPIILLMHFMMPRAVLDAYFKPPYFREAEVVLFTGFPYAPMRTVMFMTVFAFPRLGKKRKVTEAYLIAPRWYCSLSKIILLSSAALLVSFFTIGISFYVYYEFISPSIG